MPCAQLPCHCPAPYPYKYGWYGLVLLSIHSDIWISLIFREIDKKSLLVSFGGFLEVWRPCPGAIGDHRGSLGLTWMSRAPGWPAGPDGSGSLPNACIMRLRIYVDSGQVVLEPSVRLEMTSQHCRVPLQNLSCSRRKVRCGSSRRKSRQA